MSEILFQYDKIGPTTWVYLSSLLSIALFFKFNRLWSLRNLDLLGLILLGPGLVAVRAGQGPAADQFGYLWLFTAGGLFMIRMLLDPVMVRRPLLEPNLSVGGLTFLGISLLVFLLANVLTSTPEPEDLIGAKAGIAQADTKAATDGLANPAATAPREPPAPGEAEQPPARDDDAPAADTPAAPQSAAADSAAQAETPRQLESPLERHGPGFPLLWRLPSFATHSFFVSPIASEQDRDRKVRMQQVATAKLMAILGHLAVVSGMIWIGYRHFDNAKTGIAAAVLYLLMPYTAFFTAGVTHVLPAALLVWAIVAYRRPLLAGMLLGLAIGVVYYPIFLLPLWCSFYWQRGLVRFVAGVASMLLVLVGVLWFTSETFLVDLQTMFGAILPKTKNLEGFWGLPYNDPVYRIPVLAAFIALCSTFTIWPAQKNLGTLMSCSAAIMLGVQFWHGHGGGLYMGWYLPLMLLAIFRPNLEDRVALQVLGVGWPAKRKPLVMGVERAA